MLLPAVAVLALFGWYFHFGRALTHAGRRLGARWWDAAGPFVLVAGIVVLAVLLGEVPGEGDSGRFAFAGSLLLLAVGLTAATLAIGNLDEYRELVAGTDTIGGLDAGPVAVSGTAAPDEDTLTGSLSDDDALAVALRVTDERGIGYRKADVEIHYEEDAVGFALDDGTGTVLVDPSDGTVRLWDSVLGRPDVTVSSDGESDPRLDAVRETLGYDPDDDRTYAEMRLVPDSEVTVLGTAAHDPEARYPVVGDGERRLAVFEGSAEEVRDRLGQRVRLGGAAGVAAILLGAFGVFVTTGAV